MAEEPPSGLDWYCGTEPFVAFDSANNKRFGQCFFQTNFNGTILDQQTVSAQVFIFLKSICLLGIAFSWVWFRISPYTVRFYPLRHAIFDFTRLVAWFLMCTVNYLEWSRSRPHHFITRGIYILSAIVYAYYFSIVYGVYQESGGRPTTFSEWEFKHHPTPINISGTKFYEISLEGHAITLSFHALMAIFAVLGGIPSIREYFEANEKFSTPYNARDDDEPEPPATGALALLAKQCMRLETAPFVATGVCVSILRGYILQLLFQYFGEVYASTNQSDGNVLLHAVLVLTGIFLAYAAAGGLSSLIWGLAAEKVVNGQGGLRNILFQMMMQQEVAYHDLVGSGKILTRFSSDTELVKDAFMIYFPLVFEASSAILVGLVFLFKTSWSISLYMLSILPLTHAISYYQGEFFLIYENDSATYLSRVGGVVQDVFSKFHTVLIYGKKNTELAAFREIVFQIYSIQFKKAFLRGLFLMVTEMLGNATSMLALFLGITILSATRQSAYGDFVTYCLYSINIVKGLIMILKMFPRVVSMIGAMTAVLDMIQREPQPPEKPMSAQYSREFQIRSGVIEFQNVRFKYPVQRGGKDEEALRGISFKIKPNSKVAIVGGSGAGKSTIFQLLARFYDPTEGQVLIDGQDLKYCTTSSIRKHLGMVSQAHDLFAASLLENILYGTVEKRDDFFEGTPAEVRAQIKDVVDDLASKKMPQNDLMLGPIMEAIEKANATDFVDSPYALAQELGEGGKGLSGGQKQRMTIARALFKSPKILLLDEVTSALDPISEKVIQEALDKLTANRTVLIVAHRLHTIKNADLILVMGKGKVLAAGTHDELMKTSKKYARMVNASGTGATLQMDTDKEEVIPPRIMTAAKKIYEQLKRDPPLFKKFGKQIEEFCPQLSLDLASDALEMSSTASTFSLYANDVFRMRPLSKQIGVSDETESTEEDTESDSASALVPAHRGIHVQLDDTSDSGSD